MKNIHHYKNKKLVNNVFDNVYQNYDLMNDIMSFGSHRLWKEEFVKSLDLNLEYKIVDMASGTGDISYSILKKNKHQKIYRIEPNFNMLNHNISKFNNFKNIKHICSYAENVPLSNQIIDVYLISFGLRNVSEIDNVLSEANPYEYLVKSIEDFHSQTEIKNKLNKAGFKNVNIKNIFGGIASIHYAWKLND